LIEYYLFMTHGSRFVTFNLKKKLAIVSQLS